MLFEEFAVNLQFLFKRAGRLLTLFAGGQFNNNGFTMDERLMEQGTKIFGPTVTPMTNDAKQMTNDGVAKMTNGSAAK